MRPPSKLESGRTETGWAHLRAGRWDQARACFGGLDTPDALRVCRPGGSIALASFTPEGAGGDFFATVGRHAPPPSGESPLLWGDEEHVRDLLGDGVASLRCERRSYVERLPGGPGDYAAFFRETFGPLIVLREALSADPARLAELDRDLDAFAERANAAPPEGPFACAYEYLLVVVRTG